MRTEAKMKAEFLQRQARIQAEIAASMREGMQKFPYEYMRDDGTLRMRHIAEVQVKQETTAYLYRLAREAMGIEEPAALALIRAGQIAAFDFIAVQFRVYASDNETLTRRYGLVAAPQPWRDAAEDCERVAAELRKDGE